MISGVEIKDINCLKSVSRKFANSGYVYILETEKHGVKIGKTQKPFQRMSNIIASSNVNYKRLFLSDEIANYGEVERFLHAEFCDCRQNGEWFSADFNLVVDKYFTANKHAPSISIEESNEQSFRKMKQLCKEMVWGFYKSKFQEQGLIMVRFDTNKWEPTEDDVNYVINDIKELAESQKEDCGEVEWANENYELIDKILGSKSIAEKREFMQSHLLEMFHAVPVGGIHKYYGDVYADFIENALGVEYVVPC